MTLRVAHIIIVLSVTILFVAGIFAMDSLFATNYNDKANKYNTQFAEIESNIEQANYQRAISLCELIAEEDDTGTNEIKARVYIGLAQLKMGDATGSLRNIEYLMDKYPGIKAYADLLNLGHDPKNQEYIYNDILTVYLPGYNEAINEDVTLVDIFEGMGRRSGGGPSKWVLFISLQIAAIAAYERIRKSLMDTRSDK